MPQSKLRIYFNIFVVIVFISYLGLIIFSDVPDSKWSFGFIIFITMLYIIRDILAPKQKRSGDNSSD